MEQAFIDELKKSISNYEQSSLFKSNDENSIVLSCIDLLRALGYSVTSPKPYRREVKDVRDLVNYFYALVNYKFSNGYLLSCSMAKDLKIAKAFVERRMAISGYNKKTALNECGEIVRTVIDNYDEFKFNTSIGFYIFGQDKMSWVTDKAIKLMNKKLESTVEARGKELDAMMIALEEEEGKGFNGFDDLDEILANLEEKNGKEKS